MSDSNVPLSVLAQSLMDADSAPDMSRSRSAVHADHWDADHKHAHSGVGLWALVFYFLLLAVFFYFVYFALRPSFVLKKDCDSHSSASYSEHDEREIDNGRLLGAAVITALILIFVLWLMAWAVGMEW